MLPPDGHPIVRRRSTPAALMVERLRRVLVADAVVLRGPDAKEVIAFVGPIPSTSPIAASVEDDGLYAPVEVWASPDGPRSVVPVVDDGALVGWIDVVHPPHWRSGTRSSAAIRVFARLTGPLVVARRDGAEATEDQIVLEGGRAITELALHADDFEQLMGGVTAVVNGLVECSTAGVALVNDRGYLQALPGSFGATPEMVASSQVSLTEMPTAAAAVFRTGRTVIANNPHRNIPLFIAWVDGFGIKRLMTLPMIVAGSRRGVIHLANKSTDFTSGDARRAERIAAFVAGAVEQVRQRLEMRRKESLAVAVSRAATAVAAGERLRHAEVLLEDLRIVLGARIVAVKYPDGSDPVVTGLEAGEDMVQDFLNSISTREIAERTSMSRPPAPSELGSATLQTPILLDGEPLATLAILRVPCVPFTSDESAAVRRMSNIMAMAWTADRYLREQAEMARMREYREIADDIHDHVAQILFSSKLTLESVLSHLDETDDARAGVLKSRDLIVRSEVAIRDMIHRLTPDPSQRLDLVADLREAAAQVEDQFGKPIAVDIDQTRMDATATMPVDVAVAVLAAGREAMVNASKHAGPCRIEVTARVSRAQRFVLSVVDDGAGAESYEPGFGLEATRRKLHQHGLTYRIRPNRTGGTRFVVQVSLDQIARED